MALCAPCPSLRPFDQIHSHHAEILHCKHASIQASCQARKSLPDRPQVSRTLIQLSAFAIPLQSLSDGRKLYENYKSRAWCAHIVRRSSRSLRLYKRFLLPSMLTQNSFITLLCFVNIIPSCLTVSQKRTYCGCLPTHKNIVAHILRLGHSMSLCCLLDSNATRVYSIILQDLRGGCGTSFLSSDAGAGFGARRASRTICNTFCRERSSGLSVACKLSSSQPVSDGSDMAPQVLASPFPWKSLLNRMAEKVLSLVGKGIKWLAIPFIAIVLLAELSYSWREGKALLFFIGLVLGSSLATLLKELYEEFATTSVVHSQTPTFSLVSQIRSAQLRYAAPWHAH